MDFDFDFKMNSKKSWTVLCLLYGGNQINLDFYELIQTLELELF